MHSLTRYAQIDYYYKKKPMETSEKKPRVRLKLTPFKILVVLLILVVAELSGYLFFQSANTKHTGTPAANQKEQSDLVTKVGRLIQLPDGEQPTIATVSDITKLQGQIFFTHAQNGDKVLIYAQAKKAILYRPSTNKIIDVGPVAITQPTEAASPTQTLTPAISISPTSVQAKPAKP
jgi:hypothetical protein